MAHQKVFVLPVVSLLCDSFQTTPGSCSAAASHLCSLQENAFLCEKLSNTAGTAGRCTVSFNNRSYAEWRKVAEIFFFLSDHTQKAFYKKEADTWTTYKNRGIWPETSRAMQCKSSLRRFELITINLYLASANDLIYCSELQCFMLLCPDGVSFPKC